MEGLSGHRQALEEGADVEYAGQHMSRDLGDWPRTLTNPSGKVVREDKGGWTARLVQEDKAGAQAFVWFELLTYGRNIELHLTTGEARTVAAQLVALAKAEDAGLGLVREARR